MIDMTMSRAVKALHITGRRALPRRTLSLSPLVATARLQMHALRLIGCEHGLLAPLGHASLAGISCVASETAALGARNRVHAAHQPLGPAAGATWLSTSPGLPEMSGLACSRRAARPLSGTKRQVGRGGSEKREVRVPSVVRHILRIRVLALPAGSRAASEVVQAGGIPANDVW